MGFFSFFSSIFPSLLCTIVVCISGMTLGKVIVKNSRREFAAGLLYTGCSRVKDQYDLAIEGPETRVTSNGIRTNFPPKQK